MTVGNALVNLLTGILYNEYKEYSDRGEAQKVANARMMEMIKNIGVYANPSVFSDPALSASLEKYYGKEQFNEYKVMAQGDPKTGKPGIADILAGIQVAGRRLDEAIPNQSAVRPLLGGPTEEDVRAGKIGYPPTQPPQRIEQLAPSAQAPMQAPMQAQQRPALQLFSISPSGPTLHAQYPDPQSAAVFVGHLNAYIAEWPDRPQDGLYYASVEGGVAEIEFIVPPPPPGDWARSVILKSRGFYYIHVPHDGPSQSPLANRILDEPLVGNRYILERWRAMRR